ncbi:MAG: hypothetical protein GTN77_05755, partial [Planctomycetales bacterium]|nr:hypothetical protein [Planctomycetales bacterium]
VSRERVRQIETKAMGKLQQHAPAEKLAGFLVQATTRPSAENADGGKDGAAEGAATTTSA